MTQILINPVLRRECGLYSCSTTLRFDDSGITEASVRDATGNDEVRVVALDTIAAAQNATLIQLNVEGCEDHALEGTRAIIERNHTKLSVHAYHRAPDVWMLVNQILSLRKDYKLYLRQHMGGPVATVIYAVPDR